MEKGKLEILNQCPCVELETYKKLYEISVRLLEKHVNKVENKSSDENDNLNDNLNGEQ